MILLQTVRCSIAIDADHTFTPDAVKSFQEMTEEKMLEATVVSNCNKCSIKSKLKASVFAADQKDFRFIGVHSKKIKL